MSADADVCCPHGHAMDVHCCGEGGLPYPGCHSGFVFDPDSCRCRIGDDFSLTGEQLTETFARPLTAAEARKNRSAKRREATKRLQNERRGVMRRKFGPGPEGQTCAGCVHLIRRGHMRTFFKCRLYRVSRCESSDWRASWAACGKFELKAATA